MLRKVLHGLLLVAALVAAAAVVLLAVVAIQYRRNDRPISLPRPSGSYPVGRVLADWKDLRRDRELMVFVWYPARPGGTGPLSEYIPGRWGELDAAGMLPIPAARLRGMTGSAIEGAPVDSSGPLPVLVMLPGMGRMPAHYTTIAEELASHGYVVMGVTPTGSTRVVFPDGRVVEPREFDPAVDDRAAAQRLVETWEGDVSFAIDRLIADPRFARVLRTDRIGIFGHSFGGNVAAHALSAEPRVLRAANIDGALFGDPIAHLDKPLLILEAGPDPPVLDRSFCPSRSGRCEVEAYSEARHMNFSDAGVLPSRFPLPQSLLMLGDLDGPRLLRTVSDRLRAFFDEM